MKPHQYQTKGEKFSLQNDNLDPGCYGKEQFESTEMAAKIAKKKNNNLSKRKLCIYRCQRCSFYHIGGVYD